MVENDLIEVQEWRKQSMNLDGEFWSFKLQNKAKGETWGKPAPGNNVGP